MSGRSGEPVAAIADLVRSRLRALLPIGLIVLFGLSIYYFFASIGGNSPEINSHEGLKHLILKVDGLGRIIPQSNPVHTSKTGLKFQNDLEAPSTDVFNTTSTDHGFEEFMKLPILHHTFQDPFDPKSHYKPLPDSRSPWPDTTPNGLNLMNRLSRNRFPPADAADALRGSSPPPPPPWPPRSKLREKDAHIKKPISIDSIVGLNATFVWKDRGSIAKGEMPKVQWSGFEHPSWESEPDRAIRLERQGWVRRAFQHSWEGYKSRAWGHDELKPISGSFQDPFAGWGATLVDCLDTLLIMNLTQEYNYARTHVKAIDFSHPVEIQRQARGGFYWASQISFFETVIRYLGGLLSSYDLSGDQLMLQRAENLAEWLLPAFGTDFGLPASRYQLGTNPRGQMIASFCLAEIGSLTLEFTRLSQLTSKDFYYDVVQKVTDLLDGDQWTSSNRLGTLFPTHVNPRFPESLSGAYTFGAMADSYYEYLIKQYQLLRGTNLQYSRMYSSAIESARTHLIKQYQLESPLGKNLTVIGDFSWGSFKPTLDHLTCFSGGMLGLGSQLLGRKEDLDLALQHTDACVWAYESTKTGVGPERLSIMEEDEPARWQPVVHQGQKFRELKSNPMPGSNTEDGRYLGRPETIESVFYMWRITGDRQWQDRGWRMFTSWMEACFTKFGIADLKDVNSLPPELSDKEESFVLAETFKYYYLLFSEPDLISLDDFVFNTEAHPLRIEITDKAIKTFWTGPDAEIDAIYDPPGTKEGESGYGTFIQQWSRVNLNQLDANERKVFDQVAGN